MIAMMHILLFLVMCIEEEELNYVHIDLETAGEALELIQIFSAIAHDYATSLEVHSTCTSSHHLTSTQSTGGARRSVLLRDG
jgi:hypothetical protein